MAFIYGSYYSTTYTTGSVTGGEDLIQNIKDDLVSANISFITAKKLTLISPGTIHIDINNLGVYSSLLENSSGDHVLFLDDNNISISSLKVQETSAPNIFVAVLF